MLVAIENARGYSFLYKHLLDGDRKVQNPVFAEKCIIFKWWVLGPDFIISVASGSQTNIEMLEMFQKDISRFWSL